MKKLDFKDHCVPCGAWCCKGENPFVSRDELNKLGVDHISQKADGSCSLLGEGNLCTGYENRPWECRAFPIDARNGNWIYWGNCEAASLIDLSAHIDNLETMLACGYPRGYIDDYMDYHQANEPAKYKTEQYLILRSINPNLRR